VFLTFCELQPDTVKSAIKAARIDFNFIAFHFYYNAKITVIYQKSVSQKECKFSQKEENFCLTLRNGIFFAIKKAEKKKHTVTNGSPLPHGNFI